MATTGKRRPKSGWAGSVTSISSGGTKVGFWKGALTCLVAGSRDAGAGQPDPRLSGVMPPPRTRLPYHLMKSKSRIRPIRSTDGGSPSCPSVDNLAVRVSSWLPIATPCASAFPCRQPTSLPARFPARAQNALRQPFANFCAFLRRFGPHVAAGARSLVGALDSPEATGHRRHRRHLHGGYP
jgi:hypothetical protein